MLDTELGNRENDNNEPDASGDSGPIEQERGQPASGVDGPEPSQASPSGSSHPEHGEPPSAADIGQGIPPVPAATFQPPQVIFQPPAVTPTVTDEGSDTTSDATHEPSGEGEGARGGRRGGRAGRGRGRAATVPVLAMRPTPTLAPVTRRSNPVRRAHLLWALGHGARKRGRMVRRDPEEGAVAVGRPRRADPARTARTLAKTVARTPAKTLARTPARTLARMSARAAPWPTSRMTPAAKRPQRQPLRMRMEPTPTARRRRPCAAGGAGGAVAVSATPSRLAPTIRRTRLCMCVSPAPPGPIGRKRCSRSRARRGWKRRSSADAREGTLAAAARLSSVSPSSWPAAKPSTA